MKRILIALAMLAAVQVAVAQVKSPEAAGKAVAKAETAANDAKKATKVATWITLGKAYMDAYNAPAGSAWVGAARQELALLMGADKPQGEQQVELNGTPYIKEIYSNKELYYSQDGILQMIIVTQPVVEDALAKAFEAYKKAYEVDAKQSKAKDISAALNDINRKFVTEAYNAYHFGDLKAASEYFAMAAEAMKAAPLSQLDEDSIYNAGFTAWMSKDYQRAKTFFEECLANNYYYEDGEVFAKLADIYTNLGDSEASVNILEEGFTKFPQSQSILIGLINYYLTRNENPDRLFELIALAKQNEPNNASLPYVEGNIYVELRKADPAKAKEYEEKAVAAYDACAVINPEYEYGHIGKGIMFYNIALELQEKASDPALSWEAWEELNKEFAQYLKNALEPFEAAYNMSKDNALRVNIADFLKNIYYRFSTEGPEWEEGYKKYNEVVKTGQAN
jgi:hypothetical protein